MYSAPYPARIVKIENRDEAPKGVVLDLDGNGNDRSFSRPLKAIVAPPLAAFGPQGLTLKCFEGEITLWYKFK
jgi:hypothetical protein